MGFSIKKAFKSVTKNIVPGLSGVGAGALIGSIVPGIGTLVGAGIGGAAGIGLGYLQDQQIKAQNKANQQAVNAANAYDMYTWDLANQYNDPKAQVQRLIDAGFNPYTPGAITAGNASGVAGSNGVAEQAVSDRVGLGMKIAQAGVSLATAKQNLTNMRLTAEADRQMLASRPMQIAHQLAIQDLNAQIMQHNLDYAQKHGTPVTQMPDWSRDAWNMASPYLKGFLNKLTD